MCWGFFQAALECALKERAGSVGLAGFVSGYSLDIFRNYEKIDKITAPVRTAQRLGKERCQKDCADHDRSGIWSEPIVKLPRVLVREQFHAWEKFFPACLRGVVVFFMSCIVIVRWVCQTHSLRAHSEYSQILLISCINSSLCRRL